jgi:hypothetical protein
LGNKTGQGFIKVDKDICLWIWNTLEYTVLLKAFNHLELTKTIDKPIDRLKFW